MGRPTIILSAAHPLHRHYAGFTPCVKSTLSLDKLGTIEDQVQPTVGRLVMSSSEPPSPRISLVENDERPYVKASLQTPKFHVGDKVYLIKNGIDKGPYLVATVCSNDKYTLSLENGTKVENGEEIHVKKLKAV